MRLTDLETFVWLATMKSFRAVAERLNISQPAISARIAALERELDVSLFDRNQRSVVLTNKGLELLPYAQRMVSLAGEFRALAKPDAACGVVRIGVVETIVHTWLSKLMERLHEGFPELSIELMVDTTVNLRDRLVARQIDVACLMGPVSQPEMMNRPVCTYRLAWAASPRLAVPSRLLELSDIARLPIITYPRRSRPFLIIDEMFRNSHLRPSKITWSSSLATTIQLTLAGLGISAIPPVVIQEQLHDGDLVLLATSHPLPDLDYTATFPTSPANAVGSLVANLMVEVGGWYTRDRTDDAVINSSYHV